jgi:hypothetical protein
MLHDTSPYGHAPIPNIIDLSQKKQLFDLKVKGQGPTKVIMVCDTPPYGHAPTYQISLTYLERNNYLTLRSKSKQRSLWYTTHFLVMHPHTKYHSPISKDKKCYGRNKKILFKKTLFDLQVKGQGPRKVIMIHDTPPYGHAPIPNIIDLSQKKQLFDLKVKDHYGMQHTALFSCTHIPNIIDLSRKKQLFDLEVKVQTKVIMVHNTLLVVMHPHTKYHSPISKDKKCYGPNKKILFKKPLFDLQVKGQGPTKVIMVCNTPPYGHAPTYQILLTYLERNHYLTSRSKDKVPRRSLRYVTHHLMVIHSHTKYH